MKKTLGIKLKREYLITLAGSLLYSFSLAVLLAPSRIVIGGAGGAAIALNALFGFPVGIMIFLINLPLLIGCALAYGKHFVLRSLLGVLLTSVFTDLLSVLPPSNSEALVCALLGGTCIGTGSGMMFYTGVTTGGSDLCACLLKKRFVNASVGRLILLTDAVVVIACAIALGSAEGLLYSAVGGISASISIDATQAHLIRSRLVIVVTDKAEDVCNAIAQKLPRGITLVDCSGWYSKQRKRIVMCVMRVEELLFAKQQIEMADPEAFVVVGTAKAVYGRGFDPKGL